VETVQQKMRYFLLVAKVFNVHPAVCFFLSNANRETFFLQIENSFVFLHRVGGNGPRSDVTVKRYSYTNYHQE
jgi:hypothetical protein